MRNLPESLKTMRDSKREFLSHYKLEVGCIDCGYNENAWALHYDHIDPDLKSFNLSSRLNHSIDRIKIEIEKCEVRCANCHAIRTGIQQGWADYS